MNIYFTRIQIFIGLFLTLTHFASGQSHEVEIIDYYTSPCGKTTNPYNLDDQLVGESLYGDTLQITVKTSGNCDGIGNPRAKLLNDTLWISYNKSGGRSEEVAEGDSIIYVITVSECDCCFEYVFVMKSFCKVPIGVIIPRGSLSRHNNYFRYDNYVPGSWQRSYSFFGDNFDIVDGDTVNLADKIGRKQGLWIYKPPKSFYEGDFVAIIELEPEDDEFTKGERLKDSFRCFYVDDEIKYGEIIEYYQPYNIVKHWKVYTDFNTYKETFYDIDGNIIKTNESPTKEN